MAFNRYSAVAVALGVLALAAQGCGSPNRAAAEAEFRTVARGLYRDVSQPSCPGAAKGFDRAALLGPQRAALRDYEDRVRGGPAEAHLDLARADAGYERDREGGCYADDDIAFAQRHVATTREHVQAGLERLQALALSLREPRARGDAPAAAAEFRFRVRELRQATHNACLADDGAILRPAQAEVARFRAKLRGTPYAAQFDVADADAAYLASITVVECAAPDPSPLEAQSRAALADVQARIAALEGIVRGRRPAAQVCAPFDRLALDRLPTKFDPDAPFEFAEMWRRWSDGADAEARRVMDGAGLRVRVQTQEVSGSPGLYEVLAWRQGGAWAMKARRGDRPYEPRWRPWRSVKVDTETAQELDRLFAEPCLWSAPSFLSDQLPLASGELTTSVDGPVTFLDVRSGERRWPGFQNSWRLGRPATLRAALLAAAFGHERYEDRDLTADVPGAFGPG